MKRDRKGFTIVELLIVAVLGSILVMAVYNILVTNQRTYTVQGEQVRGSQNLRAAMNYLTAHLRELNTEDIVAFDATDIEVESPTRFAVVCNVTYAVTPTLTARRYEGWVEAGDEVIVFADNDEAKSDDDAWVELTASSVDTTAACGGEPAQEISFAGELSLLQADSVRSGAPLRVRESMRLRQVGDYLALGDGVSPDPLVGPLSFRLTYFDQDGAVATNAADIAKIVVTVKVSSEARTATGQLIQDSLVSVVQLRN